MNNLDPIPLTLPGMMLPTAEELKESLKASNVGKSDVVCKVELKPFNRNVKPHIKIRHYPSGLRYWVVERDINIKWKHLTMQEQSLMHAAYEWIFSHGRNIVETD